MPLREVPLEPELRMQMQSKETIRTCLLGALAGGKKQAEFRTGLTQTGPKPACFLNSLPYIGLYSIISKASAIPPTPSIASFP